MEAAEQVEHSIDLDNWGRRHKAEFARLLPDHRNSLVAYCVSRKEELLQAA